MKSVKKAINMIAASIVTIGLSQLAAIAPAAAQNQCTSYSIQVCVQWDALGYTSLGECRLAEYDRCVQNGGPPDNPLEAGLVGRTGPISLRITAA